MKHIIADCEIQKDFSEIKDRSKIWDLKMSTAITYCYEENKYSIWTYTNQNDLLEYLNGNFIIGFNSITFDCPLLLGETHKLDDRGNSSNDKYSWTNFDILHECKKHLYAVPAEATISEVFDIFRKNFTQGKGVYSLSGIAKATLRNPTVINKNPIDLFKTKKVLELIEFNLHNVLLTKDLYDFIKKHKYLINGNYDVIQF